MAQQPVATQEKAGLLGRRGTGFGALNFGCAALLVGVLLFVAIIVAIRLLG
jgi:hypothetical protein